MGSTLATPHCWGCLVFLQSLPMIHTYDSYLHQYLECVNWFEAIFKMFGRAFFEAIGRSKFDFEILVWKDCCSSWKCKADFCTTNSSKVLIYLSFLFFLKKAFLVQSKSKNSFMILELAQLFCHSFSFSDSVFPNHNIFEV